MNTTVTCTVKEAKMMMNHLSEDDMVVFTIMDKKTHIHNEPTKIKKRKGEELLEQAGKIEYQDNDFFGRFSFSTINNNDVIKSILFPQLE